MKYRKLGNTNLDVSLICLGTMTYGEQNTEAEGFEQMDYAVEKGINFFDTAELYSVPPNHQSYGKTELMIALTCKLLDCGFKTIFIVVNDNTELENQNFDRFLRASQLNPSPLRDSQVNELMPDQLRMDVPRVVFCRKNSPRLQSLITNSRHFKNRVVIDDEADFVCRV